MRALSTIAAVLALLAGAAAHGSDEIRVDEDGLRWKGSVGPFVEVSFILVNSSETYEAALQAARQVARDSGIRLELRGLIHDPKHGLTWTWEECEKDPLYPYPCYVARGRYDPGIYLSVERSDAYPSFKPGLFIVIAASGDPKDMASLVSLVRRVAPDAYVKTEDVYFGCMH